MIMKCHAVPTACPVASTFYILGRIAQMRPIATYVARSVICVSVCLMLYTRVSSATTADPIEMPFRDVDGGPKEPCMWSRSDAYISHR